jgi:hypothetical protein
VVVVVGAHTAPPILNLQCRGIGPTYREREQVEESREECYSLAPHPDGGGSESCNRNRKKDGGESWSHVLAGLALLNNLVWECNVGLW